MKTVIEILQLTTAHLEDRGRSPARRMAEDAISSALGIPRLELYLQFDKPLGEAELARCREVVTRCEQGEPIAYINGCIDFFGCRLRVGREVLIPRPETELMVDRIVKELEQENLDGKKLVDIGCGSGCIGLALKKRLPQLQVVLTDISAEALQLAQDNAISNEVEVEFRQGDLLAPFQGEKIDYLVSNPPYLAAEEWNSLDRSVRDYEPQGALVAGPTGLECYNRLSQQLPALLHPGGRAYFEIGYQQGEMLIKLFSKYPWVGARYDLDWAGHDRFFVVEIESVSALSCSRYV